MGALGDLLISTAALAECFNKFPNAVGWVVGEKFWLDILFPKMWPKLNGIWVLTGKGLAQLYLPRKGCQDSEAQWEVAGSPQPLDEIWKKCDATINTRYESYRFAWGPWRAKVPIRIGSCAWPMKWLYTHWAPWLGKDPLIHERDLMLWIVDAPETSWWYPGQTRSNLELLHQMQVEETARLRHLDWWTIEPIKNQAIQPGWSRRLSVHKWLSVGLPLLRNQREPGTLVLVNPTASRWEKAWPAEKYRELCVKLQPELQKKGLQLKVIGSPKETEWLQKVAGAEFEIIQPPNISTLIDVVSEARLLICNTSSMQFIAASQKTPTVTLIGQAPPAIWGPVGPKDALIQGFVPQKFSGNLFERDFAAYKSIEVSSVLSAVARILS